MSEAWSDVVGSLEKPDKPLMRIPPSPVPNWKHESEEATALRRAKSLQAIFAIEPEAKIEESGMITITVGGKKFDFFPATDCYYIYSTQKYGQGIDQLCSSILKYKLQLER